MLNDKIQISNISSAFATGGGGNNFEQEIQAMFLLSLLIDGFCPAMNERTKRVCFQVRYQGYAVDDLAVFTFRNNHNEGKMLCQIKHSIIATKKDSVFAKVIFDAWNDFNKEDFDKKNDRIALVTAQISNSSLKALRFLHAEAVGSIDAQEFFDRVHLSGFSNDDNRNMYNTIKSCIEPAKKSEPSDEEMWNFCKAFILLLFDMDCEESINRALSSSLIKCNSSMNALLVWSKLVEYAGKCNQSAASIDRNNIDTDIQKLFTVMDTTKIIPAPISEIDLFIPTVALIGSWRENNLYDRQIVEKISGMEYSEFESKARNMVSNNSEYLQLVNGLWNVLNKEELLCQCKDKIFDDSIDNLIEAGKIVLSQNSKKVMNQTPYYISNGSEYDNSQELRSSIVHSICWINATQNELQNCNGDKIKNQVILLVRNLLEKTEWTKWANLSDCLQSLAELAPDEFLDIVEWNAVNRKQELLNLFPQKNSDIFTSNNYISYLLWSIEALAWSPDYFIKSICTIGLLEALPYEQTNWANTPINSIVSILLPWYPQTLASIEKRKNALMCLKKDNPDTFWKILNKLLPNQTNSTSGNPRPKYIRLSIPKEIKTTKKEINECYAFLLELAVETANDDAGKQVDLVDKIGYMYEPTLTKFFDCIDGNLNRFTDDYKFTLWIKLREQLAGKEITKEMVLYNSLGRINLLIEKIEPKDIRLRYKELYYGKKCLFGKADYATIWKEIEKNKITAVKEIFDCFGIEETEKFGQSVNNLQDVAYKLGQSLLEDEMSEVIDAYSSKRITKDFLTPCVSSFVLVNKENSLLNTSLCNMDSECIQSILIEIPFTMKLMKVIEKLLPDDAAYWQSARMPYLCMENEIEELKLITNKLVACKRYVTAINIIGRSDFEIGIDAQYLYNLIKLAGTEESLENETLDEFSVQTIIGWLQKQEIFNLNDLSDIEFICLPLLDEYSDVKPHALYTRISLDPDYFCSMLELFYKKHSDKKHEIKNMGITDRLCKILLQFKITPGYDWNGTFHADVFKNWMNVVKSWSENNDRFEVGMHTVGSGLSYAPFDENHLHEKIINEELNKAENNELRRGYYLGVINQRGVHIIDPEGKPEQELAEEYLNRANKAEEKGYSRYADVLKNISKQYSLEAERIIISDKNNN